MNAPLTASIIIAIIAMISSLAGVWLSSRMARRNAQKASEDISRAAALKVDAAAYERAQQTYAAALAEQDHRVERMQAELDARGAISTEVQARLAHLEDDRTADRRRMQQLAQDLGQLKEWARGLLHTLKRRGIDFDPPPVRLDDDDDQGGA